METVIAVWGIVVSVVALGIQIFHDAKINRLEVRSNEKAIKLEDKAASEPTLVGFVSTLLKAAAERQQLSVLTAERRASNLFRVGTLLMGVSVLVPFVLVYMYLQTDPAVIAKELTTAGLPTAEAAKASQRDWHLLVAGISFGLLFIAAARGILLSEGRQREVYAREVRETAYYGDLTRALSIAHRIDRERKDELRSITDEVVRRIVVLLLERGNKEHGSSTLSPTSDAASSGEHEFAKIITETIKR